MPVSPGVTAASPSSLAVIEEHGVRLKLTVTDTPGFGDQINNDKWSVTLHTHTHTHTHTCTHTILIIILSLSLSLVCSWTPIVEYVSEQFDKFLNEEVSINRKKVLPDTRVHACVYFIPPTGHRSAGREERVASGGLY